MRFKTSEQHSKCNKVFSLGSVKEVFLVPNDGKAWQALPPSASWLHSKYVSTGFVFTDAFLGQQGKVCLEEAFLQSEGAFLQSQGAHSPS